MTVSLNPVVVFSSTNWQLKYSKPSVGTSIPKLCPSKSSFGALAVTNEKRRDLSLSVTEEVSDSGALPVSPTTGSGEQEKPKRSPLTARERLRAARVLNRYNAESAVSRPSIKPAELGSKVLDALRESDRGKKKGLPEAPGNMLDDSKRGMPPKGLTFQFPGGSDLFFIVFSFVFISTVMFATTFIVWKVGAIHFNEY